MNNRTYFLQREPWNCRGYILRGNFTFLNVSKQFPERFPDWESKEMPLLWRFNLHYFGYLYLLEERDRLEICRNWIKGNPAGRTVGWHPYPLSLRIVNWIKSGINDEQISASLFHQATYLINNLETYHPGNHLLENARALIFAGLYFNRKGDAGKWFERGKEIFGKELKIQVLRDGGYFERSIMYHALMFECVLDLINILPEDQKDFIDHLTEIAKKMCVFLDAMTHPDGKIALFNDSTFEIAQSSEKLKDYCWRLIKYKPARKTSFNDSGYYVFRNEDIYLVIDGGKIGPDYLPAHAHADLFSYELSIFSSRIVVDSGVYEYPAGEMRSYVRSTKAHNTVAIDGIDQAECWDSFRVARRFVPHNVLLEHEAGLLKFYGEFDGYSALIGDRIKHKRKIYCEASLRSILVEDNISGVGNHIAESFIHFSPEAEVELVGNTAYIRSDKNIIKIIVENGRCSIEEGWYCPRFGEKIRNKMLVIGADNLPAKLSYKIVY
ncbi:MAG: heparinase II/III family protein [Bacillota bacterium]